MRHGIPFSIRDMVIGDTLALRANSALLTKSDSLISLNLLLLIEIILIWCLQGKKSHFCRIWVFRNQLVRCAGDCEMMPSLRLKDALSRKIMRNYAYFMLNYPILCLFFSPHKMWYKKKDFFYPWIAFFLRISISRFVKDGFFLFSGLLATGPMVAVFADLKNPVGLNQGGGLDFGRRFHYTNG
jgi:hypothetical protein